MTATRKTILLSVLVLGTSILGGCATASHKGGHNGGHKKAAPASVQKAEPAAVTQLVAVMQPTEGSHVGGVVVFTQRDDGVHVMADIRGLKPNAQHAFHIHEFGDTRAANGLSAGGHYNPEGHQHGLPDKPMRHAGDLGNLTTNAEGQAHYEITVKNISFVGGKAPIIGRSVVIHEKIDDGAQPVGNAGGRIAVGVIGIAKP